ncbi:hypothetical protein QR680_012366 [Steinernema hermaphroditum]|uniref:LMBR1 domain-containing protein 2 homolog n=1 Tax=Steinernema hermaphroditum TaxID=289476 RepID=A0AA39LZQ9_9BILA|nr:hypothetical protein QR680_012366 [Steinernema hermaphroditum]
MSASALVAPLVIVFLLVLALLNKYGNFRKQTVLVSVSTFVGWYFSFLIIFILPLDISITFYNKCLFDEERMRNETATMEGAAFSNVSIECEQPNGYVPGNVLLAMWRVVYWTSQLLTWIVLPLMQSYSRAGEFTVSGKLRSAAYNNAIYYATYFTVFFVLLIYAVSKGLTLNFEHLKVILVSASNTWGLFLLTVLLGYGLVEVPRQLWQMGNKGYRLNKTYFDIDKLSADKNDAEEAIKETYRESREILTLLRNEHGYRDLAQIIVSEFSSEVVTQITSGRPSSSYASSSYTSNDVGTVGNEAFLIKFHKRVLDSIQNHHRTQAQWNALMERALFLEDIEQATAVGKLSSRGESGLVPVPPVVRFYWQVFMKRPLLQLCGIVFASMTVLIMWSECTFFIVSPTLTLAARLLHSLAIGYHYKYIQICAMVLISYLCVCAYYTVFKLKIYRYYHLDPHHQTDANSLLFSAILLCRLTPPICLNFLGMIHLDSHITSDLGFGTETQFTRLMGHLDVIPFVAKGINIYLPILIVILCLSTWFRLGTRILHSLGIDQFVSDDEMTAEMVQSGRAIVALERNRINREINREQREQYWADKLQQHSASQRDVEAQDQFDYTNQGFSDRTPIMSAEFGQSRDPHHPPTDLFSDM